MLAYVGKQHQMNIIRRIKVSLVVVPFIISACTSPASTKPPVITETSTVSASEVTATPIPPRATPLYRLVTASCTEKDCLFKPENKDDYLLGVASIKGYYQRLEITLDNRETTNCDYLVIVDGSQELTRWLLSLIDKGNTVNRKNKSNQLVIGIDLRPLDQTDQEKVASASPEHPVTLTVLSPMPPANFGACLSFVKILQVQ